jgi:hypothetical protein
MDHVKAFLPQRLHDELADQRVILDHKNTH